jgi:hypothetical protein
VVGQGVGLISFWVFGGGGRERERERGVAREKKPSSLACNASRGKIRCTTLLKRHSFAFLKNEQ